MKQAIGHDKQFIRLSYSLVDSEAFTTASNGARGLLIFLWRRHNGRNNGKLVYGLAHTMACLRCSKRTAVRTLRELKHAGLIEATELGSFSNKAGARKGEATKWRITYLP